jgi:hypothetical protein
MRKNMCGIEFYCSLSGCIFFSNPNPGRCPCHYPNFLNFDLIEFNLLFVPLPKCVPVPEREKKYSEARQLSAVPARKSGSPTAAIFSGNCWAIITNVSRNDSNLDYQKLGTGTRKLNPCIPFFLILIYNVCCI